MSGPDDDPVFNEPVATGVVRTLLGGDIALAKTHTREARRMVGQLRSNHGVNERLAQGEPGGFFKAAQTMADGTRIEVHTNDGNDTIRISTRPLLDQTSSGWTGEGTAGHAEVTGQSHSFVATHDEHPLASSLSRKTEEDGEEQEKKEEDSPYMWVGIRVNQPAGRAMPREPSMPLDAIIAMMVEPKVDDTPRGAVMNAYQYDWSDYTQADLDAEVEPGGLPPLAENVKDLLAGFPAAVAYASDIGARLHNFEFRDTAASAGNNATSFNFSANGLRCFARDAKSRYNEDTTPPLNNGEFLPYDPSLAEDAQAGERAFNPIYDSYYDARIPGGDRTAWDVVFVLDPLEEEQVPPCDPRPRVNLARQVLEAGGMASGEATVLPGEYVLHLGAYGSNELQSTRAGDRSHSWGGLSQGYFWPNDATDMMDYLYIPHDPLQLEVEVRLGKQATPFNFEVTIENYAISEHAVWPGGNQVSAYGCPYGGPNPRGPNWWDADLIIDVLGGSCVLGFEDDAGVFGDGVVEEPDNRRFGSDIYLYTGAGSDGDAEWAGEQLYQRLLQGVTGYWGYRYAVYDTTAAALAGKLAGLGYATVGAPEIFCYKPDTGEMMGLPHLPAPDPPPGYVEEAPGNPPIPGPPPDYWVWYRTLEWWYPYAYISKSACRTPYWMVMVGPQLGTGEYGEYGDPDMGLTCC